MNSRKLMYIAIVVMCVIAVVLAIYLQSGKQPSSNRNTTNNVKTEESQETLKKEFDQMFNNVVELNDYDTSNIKKLESGKNIVYTAYSSEAKEDNKLVFFIGSGMSKDVGLPSWSDLIDELKQELNSKENDFLKIAQLYFLEFGEYEYIKKVKSFFPSEKVNPQNFHKYLI